MSDTGDNKGKKFQITLDQKLSEELEKAEKWFGLSSDEDAVSWAIHILVQCYQIEESGNKFCVLDTSAGVVSVIDLHKEEEPEIEVDLEDEKNKGQKN